MQVTPPRLLICMGVSGCGKSTLASGLSARLGWPMLEADDFHNDANRALMASGAPLTEAMHAPWLASICSALRARNTDCVLACSGLRRGHRDRLRALGWATRFLLLEISPEGSRQRLLHDRDRTRVRGIERQFETFEWPLGETDVNRLDARLPIKELLLQALIDLDQGMFR